MKQTVLALAVALGTAGGAHATTLTITPDKAVYQVGETITLNVLGIQEGIFSSFIDGTIEFDPGLASYVSSSQTALTSSGGQLVWVLGLLSGGQGFGDAFPQLCGDTCPPVDGPLVASVTLRAGAPGTLVYGWDEELGFFGLQTAPGGA